MPGTPTPFTPVSNLHGAFTGTMSSVTQAVAVTGALSPSPARSGIFFFNDTNVGNCYIAFGLTASLSQFTNKLAPSASWLVPNAPVYCGPISVCWDAAGAGSLRVTEIA